MDSGRERRIAQNGIAARRINESIDADRAGEGAPGPRWLVCECARADCAELVDVGARKYREVRESPLRFVVLPGHEEPQIERVVEAQRTFLVVEKVDEAGRVAAQDAEG